MDLGMTANKDLIGNLIIYIADKCKPLYHTKLLKILYFIDEVAVQEKGSPITWLEYSVWGKGPVSKEIYFSKVENCNPFDSYFTISKKNNNAYQIIPKQVFDKSEFSKKDIEIIDHVIDLYGKKTSDELIELTHAKGSLWSNIVETKNIKFSKENTTSVYSINFADLIKDDTMKSLSYFIAREDLACKV